MSKIIEQIKDWSEVFGCPIVKDAKFPPQHRVEIATKLIEEEVEELAEAIHNEDITETADALGDLLWVTIRAMMEFGIDPDKCIQAIYDSNMSKVDDNIDDAIVTYKKYMDEGIKTYRKEKEDGRIVTYRTSDHKVLKSYKFVEPDFSEIL
jgi:predicted HAD superfamily Cof-like phosphohydrolase